MYVLFLTGTVYSNVSEGSFKHLPHASAIIIFKKTNLHHYICFIIQFLCPSRSSIKIYVQYNSNHIFDRRMRNNSDLHFIYH